MIAQYFLLLIFFTLAKCEDSEPESKEVAAKPRFYIEGDSYTINLIPFFIALKIAFVLGKVFKTTLSQTASKLSERSERVIAQNLFRS